MFEEGTESERWETLVNPDVSIAPFITRLTGISNEMLRDAPFLQGSGASARCLSTWCCARLGWQF
jgi:DNA polymerase III alpha subunit (gram-positive type)